MGNVKNPDGSTMVGLGYDVQGNLQNKSGQWYGFDYGNRLREVTGKEYYRYDAHGWRVLSREGVQQRRMQCDQCRQDHRGHLVPCGGAQHQFAGQRDGGQLHRQLGQRGGGHGL